MNRSNARRDATRVIVAALETNNLPWATNTPKNQKLDLLRGYINMLTEQFLKDEEDENEQQENSRSTDSAGEHSFAG